MVWAGFSFQKVPDGTEMKWTFRESCWAADEAVTRELSKVANNVLFNYTNYRETGFTYTSYTV